MIRTINQTGTPGGGGSVGGGMGWFL